MNTQAPPKSAHVVLPPRPNLGPEPWTEPSPLGSVVVVAALLGVGLMAAWAMLRKRKRPSASAVERPIVTVEPLGLIATAEAVRMRLGERFGETWRALTTEELAVNGELRQALDEPIAERVVALLFAADKEKFQARPERNGDALDVERTWREFDARLRPRVGRNGSAAEPAMTAAS